MRYGLAKISEMLRWAVVEKWMMGYLRSEIAFDCSISPGAVSSIVDDWRRSTGLQLAILIRDIGMTLRKLAMSPAQCAVGLRVHKLIERMGLDENSIETFFSTVYAKCQDLGVDPNHIAKYIDGLVSLLDGRNNVQQVAVSIQQIDSMFEKRTLRKRELEEDIQRLESNIQDLRIKASMCESNLGQLAEKERRLKSDLHWNTNLRDELKKHGLEVDDISKLVKATRFFKDSGFSVREMLTRFSNFKGLDNVIRVQERQVEILKQKYHDLGVMITDQQELLDKRKLKNLQLDELNEMGFGLSELKRLRYLIDEIAKETDLPTEENAAVVKFFQDFEIHYDDYLNLGKKIGERRAEIRKLSEAQDIQSIVLNITPEFVKMIQNLVRAGIKKDDLEHITKIIIQNRLSQPKSSSDENIPPMDNHPRSGYSYAKTEVQGVKTVTEESTTLLGSQSDVSRDDSTKAGDVIAKSDADAGIFADGMNLQQMMAQIHGTDTSHKDDEVFFTPKPRPGAVDQANNSRVLRIHPPRQIGKKRGIRKKKYKNTEEGSAP